MRYFIYITRQGTKVADVNADTRAELAEELDYLYTQFPRASGYEYTVTCEVITRFTLIDSEVLPTGDATQQKLWDTFKLYQLMKESR